MKKVKLHRKEILFIFVLLNILYLMKQKKQKIPEEKQTINEEQQNQIDHKKVVINKGKFEKYTIVLAFFIFSNIFIYYSNSNKWSVGYLINFISYVFINVIQYIFFDKMLKHFLFYMNHMKESSSPEYTKQFLELVIDELIRFFDRNLQVFIFGGKILYPILDSKLKTWTEINHLYRTKSWKEILGFLVLYFLIRKLVFYLGFKLKEKISYDDPEKNKNKLILCAVCCVCFFVNFVYNNIYIQFLNFNQKKNFRIPDEKQIERNKNQFQRILNENGVSLPERFDQNQKVLYEQDYLNFYQTYASQKNIELSPILKTKIRVNKEISTVNRIFKNIFS